MSFPPRPIFPQEFGPPQPYGEYQPHGHMTPRPLTYAERAELEPILNPPERHTMSTERENIAALLREQGAYCGNCDYEEDSSTCEDCHGCTTSYADAILAAGYRKPRTVTTLEELDALPRHTVIRSAEGPVFERYTMWHEAGSRDLKYSADIALPADVLHEPSGIVSEG